MCTECTVYCTVYNPMRSVYGVYCVLCTVQFIIQWEVLRSVLCTVQFIIQWVVFRECTVYCILYSLQSQFSICCSVIIQNKTVSQIYTFFLELLSFLDFLTGPTKKIFLWRFQLFKIVFWKSLLLFQPYKIASLMVKTWHSANQE